MINTARYAVLFKTHFWDDFAERQFRRLCERAGAGQVFIVVDETKGTVAGIWHDNVIRMTEQMCEAAGYLHYPVGNLFWYNTDYQVYLFFDNHPEYDYVFICEYDCVVNIEISGIIDAMAMHGLSFIGEPIRTPPSTWYWTQFVRPYYDESTEIAGRLLCCAAFSRSFALSLKTARQEHTRRALARENDSSTLNSVVWPNNEGFVGTELVRLSAPVLPLSAFGDTSHYDWAPPHLEIELSKLSAHAFVHPVLDTKRYIPSLLKLRWNLEDLFRVGSPLQCRLEECDPNYVVPMFLHHFVANKNWAAVEHLRRYANERTGGRTRALFNVAKGKPATQSSTSEWSRMRNVSLDAAGAVSGQATGSYGFHTDFEDTPWWLVDLEAIYQVREVCIYNRLDHPGRSRSLVVSFSIDLMHWNTLYRHEENWNFGGADGMPLKIEPESPVELRFLRIHLADRQILHLDEVEVFV